MLLEAPFNLTPGPVELNCPLRAATRLVRMHADNLLPVKPACLFQNVQVIDISQPKRSVVIQATDIEHLIRHSQHFQKCNDFSRASGDSCVLAPDEIKRD